MWIEIAKCITCKPKMQSDQKYIAFLCQFRFRKNKNQTSKILTSTQTCGTHQTQTNPPKGLCTWMQKIPSYKTRLRGYIASGPFSLLIWILLDPNLDIFIAEELFHHSHLCLVWTIWWGRTSPNPIIAKRKRKIGMLSKLSSTLYSTFSSFPNKIHKQIEICLVFFDNVQWCITRGSGSWRSYSFLPSS